MITQRFSYELKLSPGRAFLIISLFFLGSLSAQADTNRMESRKHSVDRKLVSTVVESFVSAWNKNDTETIAKLFLSDAVLVMPMGSVVRTRSAIRKRISDERQGKLKATTLNHSVDKISVLNNGTAIVEGKYQLVGMKILGVEKSPEGSFIIRHRKQQGNWLISKAEILKKKDE
jgi:uncharacterized protein (TIGR02246 family)